MSNSGKIIKTKLAIVEDNEDLRNRFVELFTSHQNIECVGNYFNAEDFLSEFQYIRPDVVFMDIHLPGMDGIKCIEKIKKHDQSTHFIVYTIFENTEMVLNAIKAGATGYLLKNTGSDKLVSAVEEILRGESPMSGSIAGKVIKAFQQQIKKPESRFLSQRENEILDLLAKGYRYKDIAKELFISIETVRTHIRSIYEKLQVNSGIEAIFKTRADFGINLIPYTNTNVSQNEEEECFISIKKLFEENKPFLNEKYCLGKLAKQVGYPVYVVSQTVNRRFKMGFFELINHYRIKEAINMLKCMDERITIEGIAYQCGFCSRSTFYSAFKKETGMTPGEFLQ